MSKYGRREAGNESHGRHVRVVLVDTIIMHPMPGLNMFCLLIGATNMSARPSDSWEEFFETKYSSVT